MVSFKIIIFTIISYANVLITSGKTVNGNTVRSVISLKEKFFQYRKSCTKHKYALYLTA